jgi:hypothetical protein
MQTALRESAKSEEPVEARMLAVLTARQQLRVLLTPSQLSTWDESLRLERKTIPPAMINLRLAPAPKQL